MAERGVTAHQRQCRAENLFYFFPNIQPFGCRRAYKRRNPLLLNPSVGQRPAYAFGALIPFKASESISPDAVNCSSYCGPMPVRTVRFRSSLQNQKQATSPHPDRIIALPNLLAVLAYPPTSQVPAAEYLLLEITSYKLPGGQSILRKKAFLPLVLNSIVTYRSLQLFHIFLNIHIQFFKVTTTDP